MEISELYLSRIERERACGLALSAIAARLGVPYRDSPFEFGADCALNGRFGLFVTLYLGDRLRGCLGRVRSTRPAVELIAELALSAAFEDKRFAPIRADEVDRLSVEISILSEPRAIGSWRSIELGVDGIIFHHGSSRALFLPHVPREHGWALERTLDELALKAGERADRWREESSRFEVFGVYSFRS